MIYSKNISVEFPATRDRVGYRFRRVFSVVCEHSWEKLSSTAEIVVSRNIKGYGSEEIKDLFRRGDRVVIYAGYNGELIKEFEGYITSLNEETHYTFKCEDEMFLFRNGNVNFSNKNCSLADLVGACLSEVKAIHGVTIPTNIADANIGSVRVKDLSPAEVLLKLKDDMSLYSYFRDGVLYSGKIFQDNANRITLSFDRERNIKTHSLEFKKAEDLKVKIKVTSVLSTGKKLTATAGDEDGELSTIELFGVNSQAELQQKAEDKLKLMKVDGFTGSVTLFGIPLIRFGDEIRFRSDEFDHKNVIHYADATVFKYGSGPYIEREVKVGRRAR